MHWLKDNNPAYSDIIISEERLQRLPIDGELQDINTVEFNENVTHGNDNGPAPDQVDPGNVEALETNSSVLLPDDTCDLRQRVEDVVDKVVGDDHCDVTINRRGTVTIPWPTRQNEPLSEYATQHFFTMAFPALLPNGTGDYFINRPRTCSSLSEWALIMV